MSKERPTYQRLSRPIFGLNGSASLWLGPDHLMQVSNAFGWERYRRWFFRDLQALIARRNPTRLIWNMVVGLGGILIAVAALLVFFAESSSPGERVGLNILAGLLGLVAAGFLAIALVNTLLGPTCTVYVQTPRGTERLWGPGRLPVFERTLARVMPLTQQGQVRPDSPPLQEVTGVTTP